MQFPGLGGVRQRSARLLLSLIATAGIAALATSCSLLVNTDVCAADADCKDAALKCDEGQCVALGTGCQTNKECAAQGEHVICRKDKHRCVNLITPACTTVHGDDKNDNAFFIGSILSTTGPDSSAGVPAENGIILALNEFQQNVNGLPSAPGGTGRRPYVLIGCSDNSDDATVIAAAKHLAEDVGVPAIIGGSFSGATIKVATTVTIADGILLFSPSATSADITNIDDHGLVWRSAPSDNLQASALSLYVPTIEAKIRKDSMLVAPLKLAILNKGDSYGTGLAKTLTASLQSNGTLAAGQPHTIFKGINYGNPDDPTSDSPTYADAVSQVLTLRPHIVLIFGGNEGITNILTDIEKQWGSMPAYRPHYIFSDGGQVEPLWTYVATNDDLRKRISGSAPGAGIDEPLFKSFHAGYLSKFASGSPDVFGAAGAYDIAYLLAYAAMGLKAQPITGPNLAVQLTKMSSGPQVNVGTDINAAFTKALAGSIDFNGASGPLNFDPKTGEAPSDIQIWCLPTDGGKVRSALNSGLSYSATTGLLVGTIGTFCN